MQRFLQDHMRALIAVDGERAAAQTLFVVGWSVRHSKKSQGYVQKGIGGPALQAPAESMQASREWKLHGDKLATTISLLTRSMQ